MTFEERKSKALLKLYRLQYPEKKFFSLGVDRPKKNACEIIADIEKNAPGSQEWVDLLYPFEKEEPEPTLVERALRTFGILDF